MGRRQGGPSLGFISWYFLFLIYINDLPNGLNSKTELFVDDMSLFSVVHNMNNDLSNINEWAQ